MALKLGELLVINNIIKKEELLQALKVQKQSGKKVGSILVELGYITEDILLKFLTDKFGVSTIDLNNFHVPDNVLQIMPQDFCLANKVLPVDKFASNLSIVMIDPLDESLKAKIESMTGLKVDPLVTSEHSLSEALKKYYPSNSAAESMKTEVISHIEEPPPAANAGFNDDDIDAILGFDSEEPTTVDKTAQMMQQTPAPAQQQTYQPSQVQQNTGVEPSYLEKDVISPEIEKLGKQNRLLKDKLEELKNGITKIVQNFNAVKSEIQKRLGVIDGYNKKLKPLEGTYDKFLDGMKNFYSKYQEMLEEVKTIKIDIAKEKGEIVNLKKDLDKDMGQLEKVRKEYSGFSEILDEERKKLEKGLRDKKVKKYLHSRIYNDTYAGEDFEDIKEGARKFYFQSILFRNIFMGLIVILLATNVYLIMKGGFPAGPSTPKIKKEAKPKVDKKALKKAEAERQAELERQTELDAQAELDEQTELDAKTELDTQKELDAQAELDRQAELDAQAELDRQKATDAQAELDRRKAADAKAARDKKAADDRRRAAAAEKKRKEDEARRAAAAKKVVYEYKIKIVSGTRATVDDMKDEMESYGVEKLYISKSGSNYILYSGPYSSASEAAPFSDMMMEFGYEPTVVKVQK
ncbi:hypothetical protein KAI78_10680 [bacterium]|nr:hypothetical protein [bacterium]